MKNVYRRYALAGATLSVAISIGFLMQSSEASHAGINPASINSIAPPTTKNASLQSGLSEPVAVGRIALPDIPSDKPLRATLPDQPVILLVSKDAPVGILPQEEAAPALGCDAGMVAEPGAAAMVTLTVSAPCHAGERVTFHHEGMRFTELLGNDGGLTLQIPALSETAVFAAAFSNGTGAVAKATIETLGFYDRAVVQWSGHGAMQLHAREYDAEYGADGHVWNGAPRDLTAVIGGTGGFLVALGNPEAPNAQLAEVYTFPVETAARQGRIVLSVETEITSANCGKRVEMQSIEVRKGIVAATHDSSIDMPDCDANGEFLVLKNLLEDLTIAQN